jgi:predicted porin
MKKTLIASAALLAMVGAAQAEVTLYGLIDLSYGKNLFDNASGYKADFHSGGDDGSSQGNSTSRVGLKGSMDVGGGMKVKFQAESGGIDSDGGVSDGGNFFNRQFWAGVSGSFGEVRLGRQDNVPFQTMVPFDANGASNSASAWGYSGVGVFGSGLSRESKSLQYISPDLGGIKFQAGWTPKANQFVHDKDLLSFGVTFASGPIAAAVAYQSKGYNFCGGSGGECDNFTSIAGSYDLGVAKLAGGYTDNGANFKGYNLGVVVPFSGFNVGLQYAKNTKGPKNASTEFFLNKEIFKGTYAYFDYNHTTNFTFEGGSASGYALGVIFTF